MIKKTRLILLGILLSLAAFVAGALVFAAASPNGVETYRLAVDQKGQLRLLTPDSKGRYDDEIRPNERVIEIPSWYLITLLRDRIAELERRVTALETSNGTGGPVINDASLVLYLPLYALEGNVFTSRDRYNHVMTANGAVLGGGGRIFDGIDDVITSPVVLPLPSSPGMTVMAWVNKADTGARRFIVSSGYAPWQFQVWSNNALGLEINIDGAYYHLATGPDRFPAANANYFVAFSHDLSSGVWFITVDGEIVSSGVRMGTAYSGGSTLRVGDHTGAGGSFWKGTIGEIAIYNRALSPLEIQQSFSGTRNRYK